MYPYLHKGWSRVSHNQIWAAVIATMITAAIIGIVDTAGELLTKKSPTAPVERAEISGGTGGPPVSSIAACLTVSALRPTTWCSTP
jgi:hypothetical protein